MFNYFVRKLILSGFFLFLTVLSLPGTASAHAIIVAAVPSAGSTVSGPEVDLTFTFNVRIDQERSTLHLTAPDGSIAPLQILPSDNPAILSAHLSGLKAGNYSVRWQVLATDGHITRGDVGFTVAP
ncbi:copper resistance protein CopC [Dongia sp.]|uniref:copper resistance CopC family protein n=1 Tax=Dongia sp. TaxID=1977262 RepID=UPI0035AE6A2F